MSTINLTMVVKDSAGTNELPNLNFSQLQPGTTTDTLTLTYKNNSGSATTVNLVGATRSDMGNAAPASESTGESNSVGQELLDEKWLEVKFGAGAWTPVDEWAATVDLGAIADGASATFLVRVNVPADAATVGFLAFQIVIYSR